MLTVRDDYRTATYINMDFRVVKSFCSCKHIFILTWFPNHHFFWTCKINNWFSGCEFEVHRCFVASRWGLQSLDHPSAWTFLDVWTVDDRKTGRIWRGSVVTLSLTWTRMHFIYIPVILELSVEEICLTTVFKGRESDSAEGLLIFELICHKIHPFLRCSIRGSVPPKFQIF